MFGRFGYSDVPVLPGLSVDRDGFVAKFGGSDKFYFTEPAPLWNVKRAADTAFEVDLGKGSGPSEFSVDLYAPGFMVRFPKGFSLKVHSTSAPYLTWKEGTVGEGVPTPALRWVAVSFKDQQPPIVLGFLDRDAVLQVDGELGDWTLHSADSYRGWVRVALPLGIVPLATNTAATLGALGGKVAAGGDIWWQPAPKLLGVDLTASDTALDAVFRFDRPGAIVPAGAALARLGMYPLSFTTAIRRLEGYTEEGPVTIADEPAIGMHLPVRRIPLGRAVTLGTPRFQALGTVSAYDVGGVAELGFENLLAARDASSRKAAQDTVSAFVADLQYTVEPHTKQKLPYGGDGKGLDILAANAFLYESYSTSSRADSDGNSLLSAVLARRDWYTWTVWTADRKTGRRAAALAALGGALCSEPEKRLDAAMLQAGLAAERGLGIFLSRLQPKTPEPQLIEPLWTLRNSIFFMNQVPRRPSPFAECLFGNLRVFGDASVTCSRDDKGGLYLSWSDPVLYLASSYPLGVSGEGLQIVSALGNTIVRTAVPSTHRAALRLPPWAAPISGFVAPPRYDEPIN